MDFRIRKILPLRRKKNSNDDSTTSAGLQYPKSPASSHFSSFSQQTFSKGRKDSRQYRDEITLKAFAYNSSIPGKPPVLGGRPQKGNGPVKLQTGRRSSSGDILVTPENDQHTLQDLRGGEFVVAGRPGRELRAQEVPSPSIAINPASALYADSGSPKPKPPFTSPILPSSPLSTSFIHSSSPLSNHTSTPLDSSRRDTYSSNMQNDYQPSARSSRSPYNADGLGILHQPPSPRLTHHSSMVSLLEPHEQQNATIQALWKAEYSRLVTLYGQAGVDHHIAELNRDCAKHKSSSVRTSCLEDSSQIQAIGMPKQSSETREHVAMRRSGARSPYEHTHFDDGSDESSQKCHSIMSSIGRSSSYTTRTSLADNTELITTREDLRKIVDDMRATYLKAIETHGPQTQSGVLGKKMKKKKRKSSSSTNRASTMPRGPNTPDQPEKHQLRTVTTTSPPIPKYTQRTARTSSLPQAVKAKLPSIQASPVSDATESEVGLKRADSTTLGNMMGDTKRSTKPKATIQPEPIVQPVPAKSKSSTNQPSVESHVFTNCDDHTASFEAPNSRDFEVFYEDLFGVSGDNFWSVTSNRMPIIALPQGHSAS